MSRRDIAWWYWLATAMLMTGTLIGYRAVALPCAAALTAVQVIHFAIRTGSLASFPVQVRASYLGLLFLGIWPPLTFLHWIQFVGTWAMVLADYCFLARCLSLLRWNRREPLSAAHVIGTFLRPPTKGSVLQGLALPPADFAARGRMGD